jgi:hypothetical protein
MALVPALVLLTLSLANRAHALGNEGCEAQLSLFTGISRLTTENLLHVITYSHVAGACITVCEAITPRSAICRCGLNDIDSLAA